MAGWTAVQTVSGRREGLIGASFTGHSPTFLFDTGSILASGQQVPGRAMMRLRHESKGTSMFTSIRKYTVRRGSAEELAQRVREGFVPLMRLMPGFSGYYLLDGGPDVLITISTFDSADEAFASNEKAANWARNNVLEFTKGMPEVMAGNVLIAEVK